MAHAALHFSVGMALGLALAAPRLRAAWQTGKDVAPAVLRGLTASWGLGVFAIVPSLMRYVGIPSSCCEGWWMNVFLLHPWMNAHLPPLTLVGSAAFVGCFALQYVGVLAALFRVRRR